MADTTTHLALVKPKIGGDLNAWGGSLNANLDLLDTTIFITNVPTVASAVARDLLIPNPVLNQRVKRSDTGFEERWNGVVWIPETILRTTGPIVGTLAKLAKADGVTNDTAAIQAVSAAIAGGTGVGEFDVGVHLVNGGQGVINLAGHWRPHRGHSLRIGAGTTVNMLGTISEECNFTFIDLSLGGKFQFDPTSAQRVVRDIWFKEFAYAGTADVPPAPNVQQGPQGYGAWNLFNTTTQRAKSTLVTQTAAGAWVETGPSAAVTKSGVNQGHFEALPEDPGCGGASGTTAVPAAFRIYMARTDVGGDSIDYAATFAPNGKNDGHTRTDIFTWGDVSYHKRSVYAGYDNSQVVTPAPAPGTTVLDPNGSTLNPPTNAPTLTFFGCLQVNQSYDVAIAYRYNDGTLGPRSAITAKTTANAAGANLIVYPDVSFPDGAVRICVFAAPTGQALHLVAEWPVGVASIDLHYVPSSVDTPAQVPTGALYVAGTAVSTLTPIYQAARCISLSGGALLLLLSGGLSFLKCPLKLDSIGGGAGLTILGPAGLNGSAEVRYAGDLVGATAIVNYYTRLRIDGARFTDPAFKCENGLRFADYGGGNSFQCTVREGCVEARAPHGIGVICDAMSAGSHAHSGSEVVLSGGVYVGNAWAVDINAPQTGDFSLVDQIQLFSNGDSPVGPGSNSGLSAFSGCVRCCTANITIDRAFGDGGNTFVHLSDNNDRSGGGRAIARISDLAGEVHSQNGGNFGIVSSAYDTNGSIVTTKRCGFSNSTNHAFWDLLWFSSGRWDDVGSSWLDIIAVSNFAAEGAVRSNYISSKAFFDYTRYGPGASGTISTQLVFGRELQPAPNLAPLDIEVQRSTVTLWLDESLNSLNARAKYTDGTLKSATIPLAAVARVLGTSADRGDTSPTIQVGVDNETQKFNTAISVNRTVTLSVTNAYNGARFLIFRTANATGVSTLTVLTKALAVSQWILVEFDGAAWNEIQFGSL